MNVAVGGDERADARLAHQADHRMVARVLAGDRRAEREFYARFQPVVRAVVRRRGRRPELEDDWTQEAMSRAFASLPQFCPSHPLEAWVRRVARHVVLTRVRALVRHERRFVRLEPAVHDVVHDGMHARTPACESRLLLAPAMATLSETARRVLLLHDVHGLTHHEIADRLGMATGTSKSHLHRARMRLRAAIA